MCDCELFLSKQVPLPPLLWYPWRCLPAATVRLRFGMLPALVHCSDPHLLGFAANRWHVYLIPGRRRQLGRRLGNGPGGGGLGGGKDPMRECILLAACAAGELLPQNPELPADVFTACLTTPIKVQQRASLHPSL